MFMTNMFNWAAVRSIDSTPACPLTATRKIGNTKSQNSSHILNNNNNLCTYNAQVSIYIFTCAESSRKKLKEKYFAQTCIYDIISYRIDRVAMAKKLIFSRKTTLYY